MNRDVANEGLAGEGILPYCRCMATNFFVAKDPITYVL
jgi:hypothetical protein